MRVIGGKLKGIRIYPPHNLPVRPTTDKSREALFNILSNRLDFDLLRVLDLFSGTGGISIEFASRQAEEVVAVDQHYGCYQFLKKTAEHYQLSNLKPRRANAFDFIKKSPGVFDVIFADPPFDHPLMPQLPQLVMTSNILSINGLFIMEHPSMSKMDHHAGYTESRKYGYSSFSFFTHTI